MAASSFAQETTAPINNAQPATLHQIGIVHSGSQVAPPDLLRLPEFVHRTAGASAADTWLEFSALYFIPPQRTTQHMSFDVWQSVLPQGAVTAWYPYAAETTTTEMRQWDDVLVGVMADGLETDHAVWMPPRGMESAATIKVYKAGPPGSKPDDEGTTEGDVYLFMRASLSTAPLTVTVDKNREEWVICPRGKIAASDNTEFAWMVRADSQDSIVSRRLQLAVADGNLLQTRASEVIERGDFTTNPLQLRIQLNEALVGNGLRPDEAAAQADLVMQSLVNIAGPVLVYLIPQSWTDANIPLTIDGQAEKPLRVFVGIAEVKLQ